MKKTTVMLMLSAGVSFAELIYSNDFAGTEYKAAGVGTVTYFQATAANGVLYSTNNNSGSGIKVDLDGLNLNTNADVTAVRMDAVMRAPNSSGTLALGFANSNNYNLASTAAGTPFVYNLSNGIVRLYAGTGTTNVNQSAAGLTPLNPTNYTFSLTYYTQGADQGKVDVAIDGTPWLTKYSPGYTGGFLPWLNYAVINLRSLPNGTNDAVVDSFAVTAVRLTEVYTLTVSNGTGSGSSYTNGQQVTITAYPQFAKTFAAWTGDTQYVSSVTSSSATVTMPAQAVSLTATYADAPTYLLYSNNFSGTEFTAPGIETGHYYACTNENGVLQATTNSNSGTNLRVDLRPLALTDPSVTAVKMTTDVFIPTGTNGSLFVGYGNEINDGNLFSWGDGFIGFIANQKISVYGTNNAPALISGSNQFPTNQTFKAEVVFYKDNRADVWIDGVQKVTQQITTGTLNFAYAYLNLRSQPPQSEGGAIFDNLKVEVTYKTNTYPLAVSGGTGAGWYTNGQQVAIAAAAPDGYVFDKWTGDTQYVASATASNTSVTMPAQAVSLTATCQSAAVYYTLTGSAGPNGTVAPTNATVLSGDSTNFTVTADLYYRILSLTTNGTPVTGLEFSNSSTSVSFTWTNVLADGVLAAVFTNQVANDPAGTPYTWLAQYGLTNFDADANADQDLDGLKAWQEYIAGTDPTNKTSAFKAAQVTRNVVTWAPVAGRLYSVHWSTNLLKGFTNLADNIAYPQGSYTNTTPDSRVNHYQIRVRLQ